MSSLLKRLTSVLYEEDASAPDASAPPDGSAPSGRGRRPSATASVVASAPTSDLEAVEKYLTILRDATDDDRSDGHRRFYEQLDVLKGVIPDEKMRYEAALKTARGVTSKDLLSSLSAVEAEVGQEQKKFEAEMSGAEKDEIGGKRSELERIDAELRELEKRAEALRGERASLSAGISSAEQKFKSHRAAFAAAVQKYLAELSAERTSITTHLGS